LYVHEGRANKQAKPFTFSVYLKSFTYTKDEFQLNNGLDWIVSSPDLTFLSLLMDGLSEIQTFFYKNYQLTKKQITVLPETKVKHDSVVFKTLSPLFIKDQSGRPLLPHEFLYNDSFNYISNMVLQNYQGRGLQRKLEFVPMQMKKCIVKEQIQGRDLQHFHAYTGTFLLRGCREDLELLRQCGVGYRRSHGYGNIEVVYQ
jgi:CRISPR-associated endoribonuclease Cas6